MFSKLKTLWLRQSLALRLGLWNALLFGLGTAAVLVLVYMLLERTVQERETEVLKLRAAQYAAAIERGGLPALRDELERDSGSDRLRSLMVRVVLPNGNEIPYTLVPEEWIEDRQTIMIPDGWGSWTPHHVEVIRIPRDEQREIPVVSRMLPGGVLLQVARSSNVRAILLVPLKRTMWIAGPVVVVIAAAAAAGVSWRSIRPIRIVAATARQIVATGDLSARVPSEPRGDEVGELIAQFNTLLERNGSLLRGMREALDNVAHDVRTPLTRLRASAETALSHDGDPVSAREALVECIEETDRIRRMLDALLDVSAAETGVLSLKLEAVDIAHLFEDVADLYALVAEEKPVQLNIVAPSGNLAAWGDYTRLRQVLGNLVDNAIKYTPPGGTVLLTAQADGPRVVLTVRDTGPGIPSGEHELIWRRLFRGDRSRSQRGLGLGLSVVKAVVEAHGGTTRVSNDPAGGAVFTVELPAAAAAVRKPAPAAS